MERNRSVAMSKCLRESISDSENGQFKDPEVGASLSNSNKTFEGGN